MAEFEGDNGDIEVIISDDDGGQGQSGGGDRGGDRGRGDDGYTGGRSAEDERLARLNTRDTGGYDAAEAARLRDQLAQTQQLVNAYAGRQERVEQVLLEDVAARDRARQLNELEGRIRDLQAQKKDAIDSGDSAATVALDTQIMEAIGDKRALSRGTGARNTGPAPQQQPQQRQQPQQQQAADLDPLAKDFVSRNTWYGKDPARSATAMAIHERIKASAPNSIGSADYWRAIEDGVSREHGRFGNGQAPVGSQSFRTDPQRRGGGRPADRITLTREQVSIAAKMNLKPEQYARGIRMAQERGLPNPVDYGRGMRF